jgi:cbb3-type cytochrome oxidase subunit 3
MLLLLTVTFVVICGWAFRPGSRSTHDDAARLIFRNCGKASGAARDPVY